MDKENFTTDEILDSSSEKPVQSGPEALAQFFGTAKQVIQRYSRCGVCMANLHFTHVTDFGKNLTHETARCPECGLKARHIVHRLQ